MDKPSNAFYIAEADMIALSKRIEAQEQTEWERFLLYTERLEVEAGTELIRQFERDRSLYVLTEGQLEILVQAEPDDSNLVIATVSPVAVVGEQSFLDGGARSATVRASQPSTVNRLTFDAFENLCLDAPDVGCAFLFDVARSLSLRDRINRA